MIEVAHLERRYGPLVAVDDVSFTLEAGEVVGFLGPNGAGKTTTMRILTGYLPATRAEKLVVAGHDVLRRGLEARAAIGYLPESVPLYKEMRVQEMLEFQGQLHAMSRSDRRERIGMVLERVGVADRSNQLVGNLSRGLRQRVGLAVALLPDPEVLILDEPTSGLDPLQRIEVRALIKELASEHTVLVSSHILAEIEAICPRVIILNQGKLVADGTREELVQKYAGSGTFHLEAAVGDAADAQRLLGQLPGVSQVDVGEKVGVHQAFRVLGEGDLREDIGALASIKGWALRELSWDRPDLESLFARLVQGDDWQAATSKPAAAAAAAPAAASTTPLLTPELTAIGLDLAPQKPSSAAPKTIYSLNPFDQGASRDLGAPMQVQPTDAPQPPKTDCDEESSQ
ncbi:MAG: ABC-2 type transport system ATP-binding protein [Planctomycetota bacterium]|jgi:ABC-2 type transport system ATP-binding protein